MDVTSALRAAPPPGRGLPWGGEVVAYPDTLEVHIAQDDQRNAALTTLRQWLGPAFDALVPELQLDAPVGAKRALSVDIVVDGAAAPSRGFRPSFADAAYARVATPPPPLPRGCPPVAVFHSYKGGVGRTLHLLALAKALAEGASPVLIVDADVEAPGLTWWTRQALGVADFSMLDFLAVAHAEPDKNMAMRLAVERIGGQRLRLAAGDRGGEAYVLPAFRHERQLLDVPIRPEHLTRERGAEWSVGEWFAQLGRELAVSAVLVDLRAGVTELSAPLLLDPRLQRVLVTSPSLQSVQGTTMILRTLRRLQARAERGAERFGPALVLTMITPELAGPEELTAVRESLFRAYLAEEGVEERQVTEADLGLIETPFAMDLLHLPSLGEALQRLSGSVVERTMRRAAEQWGLRRQQPPSGRGVSRPDRAEARDRLRTTATGMVRAESGGTADFLRTTALRALGERFSTSLPSAVVLGAKGSGKTFSFLQMVRVGSWEAFLGELGLQAPSASGMASGPILPWLHPQSLSVEALRQVEERRRSTRQRIGCILASDPLALEDALRQHLRGPGLDETQWRDIWLQMLADALDMPEAETPLNRLRRGLSARGGTLVVAIDGLEELFVDIAQNGQQQVALRALCRDLPNLLRSVPNLPLGMVIFVRKDLAQYAIPQNFGQFEDLHRPYALRWDWDEALRLAAWVCLSAELSAYVKECSLHSVATARGEVLESALRPVWGERLGGPGSHEAFTANWVLAALSDYQKQLQARDVVRLLAFAAEEASRGGVQEALDRRLLPPATIRQALPRCSQEKIAEIGEEIPALQAIFEKFQQVPRDARKLPFMPERFGLETGEIVLLEHSGMILYDEHGYYMPEIFRHGLGFGYALGSRPRVLALMRRRLGG